MTTAQAVLSICKERNMAVSYIEKQLGFSNGYLKKLKGDLPLDRLRKAADLLEVSIEYIEECAKYGIQKDDSPLDYNNIIRMNPDIKAIMEYAISSDPEDVRFVIQMFRFLRSRKTEQPDTTPLLPDSDEQEEIYKKEHSKYATNEDYTALNGTDGNG